MPLVANRRGWANIARHRCRGQVAWSPMHLPHLFVNKRAGWGVAYTMHVGGRLRRVRHRSSAKNLSAIPASFELT